VLFGIKTGREMIPDPPTPQLYISGVIGFPSIRTRSTLADVATFFRVLLSPRQLDASLLRIRSLIGPFMPVVIFIVAYTVTTLIGNILFAWPLGQTIARRFVPDFDAHSFSLFGSAQYWALLALPLVAIPIFATVSEIAATKLIRRSAVLDWIPEIQPHPYAALCTALHIYCLITLGQQHILDLHAASSDAVTAVQNRFIILDRLGFPYRIVVQSILPFLTVFGLVKLIQQKSRFWIAAYAANFLLSSAYLLLLDMKWPMLVFWLLNVIVLFRMVERRVFLSLTVACVFYLVSYVAVSALVLRVSFPRGPESGAGSTVVASHIPDTQSQPVPGAPGAAKRVEPLNALPRTLRGSSRAKYAIEKCVGRAMHRFEQGSRKMRSHSRRERYRRAAALRCTALIKPSKTMRRAGGAPQAASRVAPTPPRVVPSPPQPVSGVTINILANLFGRMAISYPYYFEEFTRAGPACGTIWDRIKRSPSPCSPSQHIYNLIFQDDVTNQNKATAPAAVNVTAYALDGWQGAILCTALAGILLGVFCAFGRFANAMQIAIWVMGSQVAYFETQLPFEGALVYDHGAIWWATMILLFAGLTLVIQKVRSIFSGPCRLNVGASSGSARPAVQHEQPSARLSDPAGPRSAAQAARSLELAIPVIAGLPQPPDGP
jgi:hypothetical protein